MMEFKRELLIETKPPDCVVNPNGLYQTKCQLPSGVNKTSDEYLSDSPQSPSTIVTVLGLEEGSKPIPITSVIPKLLNNAKLSKYEVIAYHPAIKGSNHHPNTTRTHVFQLPKRPLVTKHLSVPLISSKPVKNTTLKIIKIYKTNSMYSKEQRNIINDTVSTPLEKFW